MLALLADSYSIHFMDNRDRQAIENIIGKTEDRAGALLSALHGITDKLGHIPVEAIPLIARGLNLSVADVYGAITFYKDFRLSPPPLNVLKICQAESCQSRDASGLTRYARARLGIGLGEAAPDNKAAIEPVYCLGNCACSPSITHNGKLLGRMDEKKLKELIDAIEEKP